MSIGLFDDSSGLTSRLACKNMIILIYMQHNRTKSDCHFINHPYLFNKSQYVTSE